jgi:hypothetical protein
MYAIVYTMVSSGIRLGAWDLLRWKHIEPMTKENGETIAALFMLEIWKSTTAP